MDRRPVKSGSELERPFTGNKKTIQTYLLKNIRPAKFINFAREPHVN